MRTSSYLTPATAKQSRATSPLPLALKYVTHKTKDLLTRTSLKTRGELRCSGRVSSSCSTSGIRRVNLVTNPAVSHKWGKDREVFTTSGTHNFQFRSWHAKFDRFGCHCKITRNSQLVFETSNNTGMRFNIIKKPIPETNCRRKKATWLGWPLWNISQSLNHRS
jgi:hypothetical protein